MTVLISGVMGITQPPETRYTPSGAKNVRFNLANQIAWGENPKSNYYTADTFKNADNLEKWVQEGKLVPGVEVYVSGTLELREYPKNDGTRGFSLDIKDARVEPIWASVNQMEQRRAQRAQNGQGPQGYQQAPQQQQGPQGYVPPQMQPQPQQQSFAPPQQGPQGYQPSPAHWPQQNFNPEEQGL